MGPDKAKSIGGPQTHRLVDIWLESGDIIELVEGDADVVPEVDAVHDGTFRWRE